jgi:hypothetical protein
MAAVESCVYLQRQANFAKQCRILIFLDLVAANKGNNYVSCARGGASRLCKQGLWWHNQHVNGQFCTSWQNDGCVAAVV